MILRSLDLGNLGLILLVSFGIIDDIILLGSTSLGRPEAYSKTLHILFLLFSYRSIISLALKYLLSIKILAEKSKGSCLSISFNSFCDL